MAGPSSAVTDWAALRVLVTGVGVSGLACVEALRSLGATVGVAVDSRTPGGRDAVVLDRLEADGVTVHVALADPPDGTDLVVTSPGFRPTVPLLVAAQVKGLDVIGEPELAWRLRRPDSAPWLAVTGTDGKTTTVGMLESILRAAGLRTVAAGNIGLPLLSVVTGEQVYDVVAVELSSAQLYWSTTIRPLVGAVINIAPDHLDWAGTFEAYVEHKSRIWRADIGVANADDPVTMAAYAAAPSPSKVTFTLGEPTVGQVGVLDGILVDRAFADEPVPLLPAADVRPQGHFNIANALAAAALARAYGVPPEAVAAGLRGYRPDPHRNEVVAEHDGVTYVDNSKATSPHSAAATLSVFDSVVWIAGGLNKGLEFDELVLAVRDRLRAVVLLGECRGEIAAALARHAPDVPVVDIDRTDDGAMAAVVRAAADRAQPGDSVVLAPAAASMDMFRDYKARGEAFVAAVALLADGTPTA